MKLNPRIWVTCLSLGFLLVVSCTEHTIVKPKPEDLVGKYKPTDLSDNRLRADSEIDLRSDGTCELKDFPYMDYNSHLSHVSYYNTQGTWMIEDYGDHREYWKFKVTVSGTDLILNLLHNSPPYQISQEGEDVDDDILFFDQMR